MSLVRNIPMANWADSDNGCFHRPNGTSRKVSPVVVFGGQKYEMLATFVALTKSGHAYIPIDSHLERVCHCWSSRAELDYCHQWIPIGKPSRSNHVLGAEVRGSHVAQHAMTCNIQVLTIIFTSGTGKPKGCKFRTITLQHQLDDYGQGICNARALKCWHNFHLFLWLVCMYWAPTLALGGTLLLFHQLSLKTSKQLFATIFSLPIAIWTSTPSFADMCIDLRVSMLKSARYHHFLFWWGEELTIKTAQKLRRALNARIINLRPSWGNCSSFSCSRNRWDVSYWNVCQLVTPKKILNLHHWWGRKQISKWGEQGSHRIWPSRFKVIWIIRRKQQKLSSGEGLQPTIRVSEPWRTGLLLRTDGLQIKFNIVSSWRMSLKTWINQCSWLSSHVCDYNKDLDQNLLAYVVLKGVKRQFEREIDH